MNKDDKTALIIGCIITGTILAGLTIEDPSRLFGLSAGSTCETYNTSHTKYQLMFPDKCRCLYPKQADAIDANPIIKDAVNACFRDEMKRCRGWEKLGKL